MCVLLVDDVRGRGGVIVNVFGLHTEIVVWIITDSCAEC